jgi:hypothetical protein
MHPERLATLTVAFGDSLTFPVVASAREIPPERVWKEACGRFPRFPCFFRLGLGESMGI